MCFRGGRVGNIGDLHKKGGLEPLYQLCLCEHLSCCKCFWSKIVKFRRNKKVQKWRVRKNVLILVELELLFICNGEVLKCFWSVLRDAKMYQMHGENGKIVLSLTHEIFWAPKPGGLQNALVTAMVLLIAHKNVSKLIGWSRVHIFMFLKRGCKILNISYCFVSQVVGR